MATTERARTLQATADRLTAAGYEIDVVTGPEEGDESSVSLTNGVIVYFDAATGLPAAVARDVGDDGTPVDDAPRTPCAADTLLAAVASA